MTEELFKQILEQYNQYRAENDHPETDKLERLQLHCFFDFLYANRMIVTVPTQAYENFKRMQEILTPAGIELCMEPSSRGTWIMIGRKGEMYSGDHIDNLAFADPETLKRLATNMIVAHQRADERKDKKD